MPSSCIVYHRYTFCVYCTSLFTFVVLCFSSLILIMMFFFSSDIRLFDIFGTKGTIGWMLLSLKFIEQTCFVLPCCVLSDTFFSDRKHLSNLEFNFDNGRESG